MVIDEADRILDVHPKSGFCCCSHFYEKTLTKIMVFFSSCMSVKFHHELLNYIDLPYMSMHSRQQQTKRTATIF